MSDKRDRPAHTDGGPTGPTFPDAALGHQRCGYPQTSHRDVPRDRRITTQPIRGPSPSQWDNSGLAGALFCRVVARVTEGQDAATVFS
jgi:hypothetical protein